MLAERGIRIPAETYFVGAEYDCTREYILWFPVEALPTEYAQAFEKAQAVCLEALQQVAQERCRDFAFAPQNPSAQQALHYIQTRAADFAELRPDSAYALGVRW